MVALESKIELRHWIQKCCFSGAPVAQTDCATGEFAL